MSDTLADALPREIERVRNEVMPVYKEVGRAGEFALRMMEADIKAAERAIMESDVSGMFVAYKSLQGYEL